jgi:hypothetical protein
MIVRRSFSGRLGGIGGPGQTDRAVFPTHRYDDARGSTTGDRGLPWATSPTNGQRVRPGGDLEPIRQTVVAEREVNTGSPALLEAVNWTGIDHWTSPTVRRSTTTDAGSETPPHPRAPSSAEATTKARPAITPVGTMDGLGDDRATKRTSAESSPLQVRACGPLRCGRGSGSRRSGHTMVT